MEAKAQVDTLAENLRDMEANKKGDTLNGWKPKALTHKLADRLSRGRTTTKWSMWRPTDWRHNR